MKKALGFSNELDEDEILELTDDATSEYGEAADPAQPQPKESSNNATQQAVDENLPGDIFDAVIQLFNSIQPEFISSCINTEEQKRFIYNNIDQSLKKRLETIAEQARAQAALDSSESQRKMTADITHLRELNASLESKKNEFQLAQLSASRQKRALNERVHDLETQVANLEAEKEQYQLENRSLVNKLRVASVTSSSTDTEQLAQENIALKDQIQILGQKIESLENQPPTNDIEANEELQAIMKKVEQFEDVKKRLDKKIAELKAQVSEANENNTRITKELELEKADNESLRKTIETNLYAQAQSETELKAQIEELTAKLDSQASMVTESHSAEYAPKQYSKRKNKKRPIISAIDDLMESTDWFVAQEPTPMKKNSDAEDDFGYKEPAKKGNNKDDDKQLSLF